MFSLLRSMWLTFLHAFHKRDTIQYPEQKAILPTRWRGRIVLSRDPDGFFLLVEEEGVDAASHANDGAGLLEAMRSLEDAVRVARAIAGARSTGTRAEGAR